MKELLPCPFCGSHALLEELEDRHGSFHNLGCSDTACIVHNIIYMESDMTVTESINWWNTRG